MHATIHLNNAISPPMYQEFDAQSIPYKYTSHSPTPPAEPALSSTGATLESAILAHQQDGSADVMSISDRTRASSVRVISGEFDALSGPSPLALYSDVTGAAVLIIVLFLLL